MAGRILDDIKSPLDLRCLSDDQLTALSQEIRDEIIHTTSKYGGHLAPNLGVVELTIGLHLALDCPKDKVIWDVGHQSYVHKLLTGRLKDFSRLRQYGGMSGFPKRSESPYDCFDTGHASNSISVALGMAIARDHQGGGETVVAVIGDGSMTGGMAFEALNQAGHLKTDMIIVLNDNEMSIDGNVGGLSRYLNRARLDPNYNRLRQDIEHGLRRIPGIGEKMFQVGESLKAGLKQFLVPGMFFEELGIKYIGPIDGHDIEAVRTAVMMAKPLEGPILIHAATIKGKGYGPAEKNPDRFHGTAPFTIKTGQAIQKKPASPSYGRVFGAGLAKLAIEDQKIVAISAAMAQGTGLDLFAAVHPARFFDVGIAEQHAVTFAAGLAQAGLKPVVAIYSTFLQRAYDQLIEDVCLQNLPVVFALDRAGLVGDDGPTHHGVFDIAYLSHMPEMLVMAPKDESELQRLLGTALDSNQPAAIRYPRGRGPGALLVDDFKPLPIGKSEVLTTGKQVALMAVGRMVSIGREVVERLKQYDIDCTLVNARFVKPIDKELILDLAGSHELMVTIEDGSVIGGYGSMVAQIIASKNSCQLVNLGLPDHFISHGTVEYLLRDVGLDAASLTRKITEILDSNLRVPAGQSWRTRPRVADVRRTPIEMKERTQST